MTPWEEEKATVLDSLFLRQIFTFGFVRIYHWKALSMEILLVYHMSTLSQYQIWIWTYATKWTWLLSYLGGQHYCLRCFLAGCDGRQEGSTESDAGTCRGLAGRRLIFPFMRDAEWIPHPCVRELYSPCNAPPKSTPGDAWVRAVPSPA
jgi:hypothetical protein